MDPDKKNSIELESLRNADRLVEVQSVLEFISDRIVIPLYLLFWFADLLYVPQYKWEFLALRLAIIPLCAVKQVLSRRANTFEQAQAVAAGYIFLLASSINYMIFRIHDPGTPYYAGLTLIGAGSLAWIPWSRRYYILTAAGIFLPFYLITIPQAHSNQEWKGLIINSFFVLAIIFTLFLTRFFNERLRKNELASRMALDRIVQAKIRETLVLQEEVRHRERLTQVAKQASHDILSPISALNLVIQSLGEIPEQRKSFLLEASSRVNDIANDLLHMARGVPDETYMNCRPVDLTEILGMIEQIVMEKKLQLQNRSVRFKIERSQELVQLIANIDPTKLKRLLSNLVHNSLEAISGPGEIRITLNAKGSDLVFQIIDDGRGIPKEILPELAREGFSFGKANGNGLGLFMARRDVESWGGCLKIQSEPGRGTTVEFCLPHVVSV